MQRESSASIRTRSAENKAINKRKCSKKPLQRSSAENQSSTFRTTGLPPVTVVLHGLSNLGETGNVGTSDQGRQDTISGGSVLLSGAETVLEAVLHDLLQAAINLLSGPADTGRVLSHLQTGDSDTTSISGLTGSVPNGGAALASLTVGLEDIDSLLGGTHVGALGDELAASGDQSLGLGTGDLVLGSGGESDVDTADDVGPGAGIGDVLELGAEGGLASELGDLLTLNLDGGDGVDLLGGERALLAVEDEGTLRVGQGDDGTAELDDLQGSVLGDVAGTGDADALAGERLLAVGGVLDHVLDVVDDTVAGGLGTDERAAPAAALTGENTLPLVADLLVLAEHEADLTAGHTDVTGRDVSVLTDVLAQLGHEGDTEAANLVVGLALGVEVGATLATTHVQAGQGILEDLLEAEELQDGQVNRGVEAETALVGAESGVELNAETAVDLDLFWLSAN